MSYKFSFDPKDITQEDLNELADAVEEFIRQQEEMYIIPKKIIEKHEKEYNEGRKTVEKLIKKWRKGNTDTFNFDED